MTVNDYKWYHVTDFNAVAHIYTKLAMLLMSLKEVEDIIYLLPVLFNYFLVCQKANTDIEAHGL